MATSVAQRIGAFSRLIFYPESTRGADPGSPAGVVVNLRDQSGFQIERGEVEAPNFIGTILPFSTAPGPLTAQGPIPCGLEFTTSGNFFKMPFGANGYSKTALVTGSIHNFFYPPGVTAPLSGQLQAEYLETTAQYERARYCMLRSIATGYAAGGSAPLDLDFVGSGDVAFTDLAGTKTDNGYSGVSVYNGVCRLGIAALVPTWYNLSGITGFNWRLDAGTVAEQVAFNDGVAGSVNSSIVNMSGNLELMMAIGGSTPESDLTFLNYAINRNLISFDCMYADAAVGASPYPTKWLRISMASVRFNRRSTRPGGRAGNRINQDYMLVPDTTLGKIAAEAFGTVVGPYNIGATTNIFSVKFDGGSTINVTLTQGAARTATQIVGELNADGGFSAAGVADVFNGRVRCTSKQVGGTGSSSSVQFQTGTANHCGAVLGFNATSIAGFNSPAVIRLYNAQSADY